MHRNRDDRRGEEKKKMSVHETWFDVGSLDLKLNPIIK